MGYKKALGLSSLVASGIIMKGIKWLSDKDKKERQAFQEYMLAKQNELDEKLWRQVKDKIRNFTDEEFEELAQYIDEEVCKEPRRYSDPRHEVYSRLKHDMISYQYEKVLSYLRRRGL